VSNVGALDQIRTFLRQHPDLHKQQEWYCGTTACVAGWTVALEQGLTAGCNLGGDAGWLRGVGSIELRAALLLGLTHDEADALFIRTTHKRTCNTTDEAEALLLIDALIARDKGELCDADREVLRRYYLPEEPAGDPT
jgi:hypothetical protein